MTFSYSQQFSIEIFYKKAYVIQEVAQLLGHNIAESFLPKNFGDIGKFGNIGTFGDMGIEIKFYVQKIKNV